MNSPGSLLAGVDLKKPSPVIPTREAIVRPANSKFFISGAHVGLSGPLAATVVVDCIDIVETGGKFPPEQDFASVRGDVPPALRCPAIAVLVADRNPDPAGGVGRTIQ